MWYCYFSALIWLLLFLFFVGFGGFFVCLFVLGVVVFFGWLVGLRGFLSVMLKSKGSENDTVPVKHTL